MRIIVGAVHAIAGAVLNSIVLCDALWVSSYELSSALGIEDDDELQFDDLERVVSSLARVSSKEIHIDIGNGESATPAQFHGLAQSVDNTLNLVVDDTVYPRPNSFDCAPLQICSVEKTADRWRDYIELAVESPNIPITLRTERCSDDAEGLQRGLESLTRAAKLLKHSPAYILVHHVDFLDARIRHALRDAIAHPLMVLSTLSPHATVNEFREAGAECLVIPNVLTVHRLHRCQEVVSEIFRSRTSVSWRLPTFEEHYAAIRRT